MSQKIQMQPSDIDSQVVLMCGISGSGKTFFSRKLERRGYMRLSLDEMVWEKYGADFEKIPFEKQKDIFAATAAEMVDELETNIKKGKKVVLDSTLCKKDKRDSISLRCRNLDVEPLIIYMQAPLSLLEKRMGMRMGTGPNDQIVPIERLAAFYKNFEAPRENENYITIEQE